MKWLVALAASAAACSGDPCPDAVLLEACPGCGPGEIRGGLAILESNRSIHRAALRPGGGIARLSCETHLVLHDSSFAVEDDIELDHRGFLSLESVGPDGTIYLMDHSDDPPDPDSLFAVDSSGTERWRIEVDPPWDCDGGGIQVATGPDALFAYGSNPCPFPLGDVEIRGHFVVSLQPEDGQLRWAWSSVQSDYWPLVVAPGDDGSLAVAGMFEQDLDLGGTAPVLEKLGGFGFVGVLDAAGRGIWARQPGGAALESLAAMARAPDGSIGISGEYRQSLDLGNGVVLEGESDFCDHFFALLAPDGSARWGMNLGDCEEHVEAMAATESALVVGGSHFDPLSFGDDTTPQGSDAFIVSLTDGAISWLVQIGGAGNQLMSDLGWNGALHAGVIQYAGYGEPPASLDFGDLALEGDGSLRLELGP